MQVFRSLATLVAICTMSLNLHAQDSEEAEEEIIVVGEYLYTDQVNALKSPTPIIDVPQSLSIITADQIGQRGYTSLSDIVNYTPGVSNSQGEGHRDAIVFRGVRSTADFFLNGVRDDVQYYRPLYNLEQVEILRGPNALLFGRGGTGGILNRVTKKGIIGEEFTQIRSGFGTFSEFDIQIDHNYSTSDDKGFRVNAMFENLANHRDFYDASRFGINPSAKFKLNSSTTLDLSYEYVDHERFIDRGVPTGSDGRPVKDFKDIVFGDPEQNTTVLTAHLLSAAMQHNFSDALKGNFSAFLGDYDKLYQNFYASGYGQAATPDLVTLDGYIDTTQRRNLILSGTLIAELVTGATNHTVVAGGEYIDTSSDQDRYNAYWDTTSDDNEIFNITRPLNLRGDVGVNSAGAATTNSFETDLNDDTHVGISVLSIYVQDEVEVSDKFDVIVGMRYDSFDIEVFNVPGNETRTRTDGEFSPRVGVVFKPKENVSFYGSYSQSFLPRSGEQFANINGNNNQLDPNTFSNLEGGVKWDLQAGMSLTLAIFEVEQSSPQVSDDDPATLDVIDSQISGFEMQLKGYLNEAWYLLLGYGTLDGEQVNRSGPTGLRPRELPESMFSMWHNFQVNQAISFGFGMTYQDDSFVNNSNSAFLPSYTRFDASASYDHSDQLRIQLHVENLTDKLYFPNSHSTHQATVGEPLNARITVRYDM